MRDERAWEEFELAKVEVPAFRCGHPRVPKNSYVTRRAGRNDVINCRACSLAASRLAYENKVRLPLTSAKLEQLDVPVAEVAAVPLPLAPPVVVGSRVFRTACKARSAENGLQCKLLAHDMTVKHRNERGEFTAVLQPGQDARGVLELGYRATIRNGVSE